MPNTIDQNGLTIQTYDEIVAEIENGTADFPGLLAIYGSDINLDPNSPDGQMVGIYAQGKLDVLEQLQQIYNSFDPDKAIGVALNARCAINGVIRYPGTPTIQTVTITVGQALTLPGLDTAPLAPFTVSDNNGNQFALQTTHAFGGAGSADLVFQSVLIGPISSLPNTITNQVTITAGVTGVNNAAGPSTLGLVEETDYALRIRRQLSVQLPNQGYLQGLISGLVNVTGVTQALVLENNTNTTDANGIPGHSIWCIVAGGANADIANAIYVKRNAGCGMKGTVAVAVTQPDGSTITIYFDRPTAQNLWLKFNVVAIGSGSVDPTYIRQQLLAQLSYGINQTADTTSIVALIKAIAANASVSAEGLSPDNVTYTTLLSPTAVNNQFALSSPRIIINGTPGP